MWKGKRRENAPEHRLPATTSATAAETKRTSVPIRHHRLGSSESADFLQIKIFFIPVVHRAHFATNQLNRHLNQKSIRSIILDSHFSES